MAASDLDVVDSLARGLNELETNEKQLPTERDSRFGWLPMLLSGDVRSGWLAESRNPSVADYSAETK